MRLTNEVWMRFTGLVIICLFALGLTMTARGQGVATTTVQGTVYLANGQAGGGTLTVSWPMFTTSVGQMVAADHLSVPIGSDGFVSINLAPNQGALPAGEYYTAVFYMSDGTVNTQYWIVPAAAQATLAQVQAQVMPAAQAVQAVSKAYVDQEIAELTESLLTASGGDLTGPLFLNGDPTQPLQAADKHYVDSQVATTVPLGGGNMTGPLTAPGVNGVEAPAGIQQPTLQAAMNAAGSSGAMEIPPTYAGTDTFTNPNGVRVTDLRTSGAQQIERSVKEFGAVCDGVTDDTNALQAAINYAQTRGVALTIPQGTCKTRTLIWHGESIGGLGKQVSALMGFPGQDVLATSPDNPDILSYTRLHDLTIYVDQSQDVSCSRAQGRATAGSCQLSRPMESNTIFSPGGNGLKGIAGSGSGWAVGNCAIAMQATTGAGGNGLKNAQIENLEIVATGTDPMATQYTGAHSTHACGLYLAQWPQWSEFKNIDIRGLNTGIAIPALPVTAPAGLLSDSNRWQNITIQATHAFTAAVGCNGILDDVTAMAGNSAATGEPPTGIVLDLESSQEGWTVRNAVVIPDWNAVQPALTVTAAGGVATGVTIGADHGLGWDPYGTTVPVAFSGACTAQASAAVNSDGSIGAISITQGGTGCSSTTTSSINAPGNWDTAAPVNLIGGQNMTFFAGSLLRGHGGYTVWNATGAQSYGTQVNGGGGNLPGGGSYAAFIANNSVGSTLQVDQFQGADFGAKLQACVNAVNTNFGGTCDARNFTGSQTMSANLTISTPNTTVLLPCATITTANRILVTAGTRNVALRGCAMRGGSAASGSQGGTAFAFSGTGAQVQVGDPTYAVDTPGFHMDNSVINTTASTSAGAEGLIAYRTQEIDLEDMYLLGNSNQTGLTLDGTGNYSGGTIRSVQLGGFQTAVNAIGHQVANPAATDWMNASTFVRLHIDCPTANGNPIVGTVGINLQQGDGNTFTGGDVEGCATALHLGANAQNNTIIGLRNENSSSQVVADTGSAYNNWITGGTMFTGQLTDNGTRNSFQDSFHRSFNGMNGDWYGSQQDATVTNHFRLGTGAGNERGLLNEYQTDFGYRWTEGLSDAAGGEQFYQILDQLNSVYRLSIGQYNNGQSSTNNQTALNSAGTGAVVLNGTSNSGTGGVTFGSGGLDASTVATISNSGNAQFNGTLMVGGTSQSTGTLTVRNNADAEVDYYLWPGGTTSQKGSFTYKDWNGISQWYLVKDSANNWALNSAVGGLDSFKAYQSTNSGDTYLNASNSSGHIRLNYETGSGAETDIYSGSSSSLVASFLGPTSVKLPGLAASSGHNCLQIDNSGYITSTGIACGTGSGNGTISSGNSGQIAYYTSSGTTIAGVSAVPVTAGGTGSTSAAGAVANLLPGVASDGNQGMTVSANVAASAVKATTSFTVGQSGLAITGNQGTGALVQHSTGAVTPGDYPQFDSNGNVIDSGISAAPSLPFNTAALVGDGLTDNGPMLQAAYNACPLTQLNLYAGDAGIVANARSAINCEIRIPSSSKAYSFATQVYAAQTWNANLTSSGSTITVVPTSCVTGCNTSQPNGLIPNLVKNAEVSIYSGSDSTYNTTSGYVTGGTGSSFTIPQAASGNPATGLVTVFHSAWVHADGDKGAVLMNNTGQNWLLNIPAGQYSGWFEGLTVIGGFSIDHTALSASPYVQGVGLKGWWEYDHNQFMGSPDFAIYIPGENGSGGGIFNHSFHDNIFSDNCGSIGMLQGASEAGYIYQNNFWRNSCPAASAGAAAIAQIVVSSSSPLNTITVTQANSFAAGNIVVIANLPSANAALDGNYYVTSATSTQWTAAINAATQTVTPASGVAFLSSAVNPDVASNSTVEIAHDNDYELHSSETQTIPYWEQAPVPGSSHCALNMSNERFGSETSSPFYPPSSYVTFGPLVPIPGQITGIECIDNVLENNWFQTLNSNYPSGVNAITLNIPISTSSIKGNRFGTNPGGAFSGPLVNDAWMTAVTSAQASNNYSYRNLWADDNTTSNDQALIFGYNNWANTNGAWTSGNAQGWNAIIPNDAKRTAPNLLTTTLGSWTTTSATLTQNLTGPDGVANSAYTLTATAPGSTPGAHGMFASLGPGNYTCSVFLQAGTTQAATIYAATGSVVMTSANNVFPLDSTWRRVSIRFYSLVNSGTYIYFYVYANQNNVQGTIGVYGPECEAGNIPTVAKSLPTNIGASYQTEEAPNSPTGTAASYLVKRVVSSSTSEVQTMGATDTVLEGICEAGCGTTLQSVIATRGSNVPVTTDNTTFAVGDYVGISPNMAGTITDLGTSCSATAIGTAQAPSLSSSIIPINLNPQVCANPVLASISSVPYAYFTGGAAGTLSASATAEVLNGLGQLGTTGITSTNTQNRVPVPEPRTLYTMKCIGYESATNAGGEVITFYHNSVASTAKCTLPSGTGAAYVQASWTGSISLLAGDTFYVAIAGNGGTENITNVQVVLGVH